MKRSIRVILLSGFAAIILIVLSFVYIKQYINLSDMIEVNQVDISNRYLENVNDSLANKFSEMDSMSQKVIYSLLTSNMINWKAEDFSQANVKLKRETSEMLYYISNLEHLYRYTVKLYNSEGKYIYLGSDYAIGKLDSQPEDELLWARPTLALNGSSYITQPYDDESARGGRKISLCRAVKNLYTIDKTVVFIDVQILEDRLFENINKDVPDIFGDNYELLIVKQDGQILYNRLDDASSELDGEIVLKTGFQSLEYKGKKCVAVVNYMDEYDCYTIALIPEKEWRSPLRKIAQSDFGIALALFCFIALATFVTTLTSTRSLVRLSNEMTRLNIEEISKKQYLITTNSRIKEISNLVSVINDLLRKIYDSVNEIYESRIQETQMQLRALQLMVDPHFLFNSLGVIKILAKREKTDDTIKAVDSLAQMMFYLSNQQDSGSTIREEMQHTENYLRLMQIRLNNTVDIDINVPEEMQSIVVPRVIIQPLIENCFKNRSDDRQLHISISGRYSKNLWSIEILDNGIGFTKAAMEKLYRMMNDFDEKNKMYESKIGGYSLVNTYTRIRMMYGKDAMIDYGNREDGGAFVRIGGCLNV